MSLQGGTKWAPGSSSRTALDFITICIVSLLVTAVFLNLLPDSLRQPEGSDYAKKYEPAARNLFEGKGFLRNNGIPETRIAPGFPVFLTAAFATAAALNLSEALVLTIFNMVCIGLTPGLIYLISKTVWSSWVAFLPSLLWITYPFALWLTKGRHTELPFIVVFLASIYIFLRLLLSDEPRASRCLMAGFLAGIAMLIRPIAIGLGLLEASLLLLLRQGRSFQHALALSAILLVGNVTAVLPWELWLYSVTGRVILLSTGGQSAVRDGLTFAAGGYAQHAKNVPDDVHDLMESILRASEQQRSLATLSEVLRNELFQRPLAVLKLIGLKVIRSWFGTDTQRFEGTIKIIQAIYLLIAIASTTLCWRLGGPLRALVMVVWMVVFYFWAMTSMAMSLVRYMVPSMALLFLLFPALFLRIVRRT